MNYKPVTTVNPVEGSRPDEPIDWRSERPAERARARAERRAQRASNGWVAGLVLIALGLVFLGRNMGLNIPLMQNWWALFILIPAVGSLATAWSSYQSHGSLDPAGRGSLVGGIILTLVAAAFLFGLDWGLVFPLLLILGGIAALLGAFGR